MDIETVTQDIENWIVNFVEVPHPAIGGWAPCPFARSARMKKTYDVRIGIDPYFDLKNQARWGMGDREVIIYAYDPAEWPYELFSNSLKNANREHLLPADIIALEDHPSDVEMVNGVCRRHLVLGWRYFSVGVVAPAELLYIVSGNPH